VSQKEYNGIIRRNVATREGREFKLLFLNKVTIIKT